ncbi:hypothetical protein UFOVP51_21 [uncultured Caudovirales phage]|uniref:Uncharacterized protein n=1 Tax=uncultured Caudovirales phage TaxID=2100421 RepID=A0A6J5KSG9_9CAUD|nr:hypothetical protein UFOVP51_21 [uncultured Caudovirales phage]CAB4241125.1 hypothetical protein UFOVP34_85 [uncultured Caudovirales phage]
MILKIEIVNPYKTGKRWKNVVPEKDILITNLGFGNGTGYSIVAFRCSQKGSRLFLGIERVGCFSFPSNNFIHPNYAAQKLNLCLADASNIADWLNAQLDIEAEEFGHYNDALCIDRETEKEERDNFIKIFLDAQTPEDRDYYIENPHELEEIIYIIKELT